MIGPGAISENSWEERHERSSSWADKKRIECLDRYEMMDTLNNPFFCDSFPSHPELCNHRLG